MGLIVLNNPNTPRANAALADTETPTATSTELFTETPTSAPTLTDTATATATATATETATETPTATATLDPCSLKPAAPKLRAPSKGKIYPHTQNQVEVRWKKSECADSYRVKVFQNSKNGKLVARKKGVKKLGFVVKKLAAGYTYYWTIEACNAAGCARSKFRNFVILPPPTPTPTPVPDYTSTPAANPPSSYANYQGPSVYLGTEDPVYYFDCTWKWRPMGDIVLIIAMGFEPAERVRMYAYEISSDKVAAEGKYIALGNGWVATAINTSLWPGGHFHLLFTGERSRVQQCGHFDLDHGPPTSAQDAHSR